MTKLFNDPDFIQARLTSYIIVFAFGLWSFSPFAHFDCENGSMSCIACGLKTGFIKVLHLDINGALSSNLASIVLAFFALLGLIDLATILLKRVIKL